MAREIGHNASHQDYGTRMMEITPSPMSWTFIPFTCCWKTSCSPDPSPDCSLFDGPTPLLPWDSNADGVERSYLGSSMSPRILLAYSYTQCFSPRLTDIHLNCGISAHTCLELTNHCAILFKLNGKSLTSLRRFTSQPRALKNTYCSIACAKYLNNIIFSLNE